MSVAVVAGTVGSEQAVRRVDRATVIRVLALHSLGYSERRIAKELGVEEKQVRAWVRHAGLLGLAGSEDVQAARQEILSEIRRRLDGMKVRYGEWSADLLEDLLEIATVAARIVRSELERAQDPQARGIRYELIYKANGTLDLAIRNASLLVGKPTDRRVVTDEEPELELPRLDPEELGDRMVRLGQSLKEVARRRATA